MMKLNFKQNAILLLVMLGLCACSSDDVSEPLMPTIFNVEVGLHDNELGVLGEDFHFNAEILAGDVIDLVKVNIVQRADETYSHDWSYEIIWDQYQGVKNAQIHQHFDIDANAARGTYDYIITVIDQNGAVLEEVREVNLIDASDYPEVTPYVQVFGVDKIDVNGTGGFNNFYNNDDFRDADNPSFSIDEALWASIEIGSIKGDGIMYGLLIKKSHNHKPENIEAIDFSKAIVTEIKEHTGYEETRGMKNSFNTNYNNHYMYGAPLTIGATEDNLLPTPNPITGGKTWENGTYYYGVVYTNITYNRSTFKYIEFEINGF
ncbi:MAG: DUF4625 domain-containing protein [Winogradskyella arenosi]